MEVIIQPDIAQGSRVAAQIIARLIRDRPETVLGLATGSTPTPLYSELVRMHREEMLDFGKVTTFNLDEYVGLSREHPSSYNFFMRKELFQYLNIPAGSTHLPNGQAPDIEVECARYEAAIRKAGGIDLQVLGIGSEGHIGFNEKGSSLASRTRIKTLTERTRLDNARYFVGQDQVPVHVITMGVGTIMEARTVVLLAFGASKADAIAAAVEGPISSMNPASILQMHPQAKIIVDAAAASKLQHSDYYKWVYDRKPQWQR